MHKNNRTWKMNQEYYCVLVFLKQTRKKMIWSNNFISLLTSNTFYSEAASKEKKNHDLKTIGEN